MIKSRVKLLLYLGGRPIPQSFAPQALANSPLQDLFQVTSATNDDETPGVHRDAQWSTTKQTTEQAMISLIYLSSEIDAAYLIRV
jgi:hypothetical protein